jgi:Tannase and feruloyl esterase
MKVSAIASVAIAIASSAVFVRARTCEQVSQLHLPNTQIESAEVIPAGQLRLKPGPSLGDPEVLKNLPQFCRVLADIRPTRDSNIKIEVWLPISGWNGKFEGVGNGGWAGSIFYPLLGLALQQGYAAAATNTGHDGNMDDASFALGHPEKGHALWLTVSFPGLFGDMGRGTKNTKLLRRRTPWPKPVLHNEAASRHLTRPQFVRFLM